MKMSSKMALGIVGVGIPTLAGFYFTRKPLPDLDPHDRVFQSLGINMGDIKTESDEILLRKMIVDIKSIRERNTPVYAALGECPADGGTKNYYYIEGGKSLYLVANYHSLCMRNEIPAVQTGVGYNISEGAFRGKKGELFVKYILNPKYINKARTRRPHVSDPGGAHSTK